MSIRPRTFGNDSCPAVEYSELYYKVGSSQSNPHAICYAPYATGDVGFMVTDLFRACTGNATVKVVRDPSAWLLYAAPFGSESDCWYAVNVTEIEEKQPDYGKAFSDLEGCMQTNTDDYPGSQNSIRHIKCFPKSAGHEGPRASKLAFGVVAVLAFSMLLV